MRVPKKLSTTALSTDVSFLAGLLVDKFCYHLPLYRQHQHGELNPTWFWPIYGAEKEICFTWSRARAAAHLEAVLKNFEGVLLSDGYKAYDALAKNKPNETLAHCWAHSRRYFERAKDSDPGAKAALKQIAAIYKVEAEIREAGLDGEHKLRHRGNHARPLVDDFFEWCRLEALRAYLVDSDLLSKALAYVAKRKEELKVFLGDPDVPIDTNHPERALRVIPMSRKNWLFCWTEVGAELVGIIQSLPSTCRLQAVDPYTYLVDVLQRVTTHPAGRVEELTPRLWKERFADKPMRSDLDAACA